MTGNLQIQSVPEAFNGGHAMVEFIYGVATSLDGFVAPPDGSADWLAPFSDAGRDHVAEFLASVDALVMGSRTYEQMLTFGEASSFGKPCYVFSSRKLPVANADFTVTSASPAQAAGEMERRGITRVWHFGGGRLFSSFRNASLITGYSLGIVPVVLGAGIPLFESPGPPANLRLVDSRSHSSGVLMVNYQVVPG
jgi:dihydrofolate reductase